VVKRRSFEDGLTADEEIFLKQGRTKLPTTNRKSQSPSKPKPKQKEPDMVKSALNRDVLETPVPTPVLRAPVPASVVPSNLSVRIDPSIAAATLRAMTERKIQGITPSTQQNIVAEAMVDFLLRDFPYFDA
jgi:hypothetical protein